MALYRVQSNGKAPLGLKAGDEVVTGGGTYRILGVNSDGSYRSALSNKYQTTGSYRSTYGTPGVQRAENTGAQLPKLTELTGGTRQTQVKKPGAYSSQWTKTVESLYDEITNRKAFSYDLGTDPMYQQYRQQYQKLGRAAMEDTMGKAASLTGGYGSSYSQSTGQQAYNAYLQSLNEVVPELYSQARAQYDQAGNDLLNRYQLAQSREQADYEKYRDAMQDYYSELADARSREQYEANLALQYAKLQSDNYWNSREYDADRADAANAQYWKQQAYADKQAAAAEKAYQAQQKAASKSSGSGTKKKSTQKLSSRSRGTAKTRTGSGGRSTQLLER